MGIARSKTTASNPGDTNKAPASGGETQRHGKALLWSFMWMLTVCVENVHHSLWPLDRYGPKTAPVQRLLLHRVAKPVSMFSCI